MEFRILRKTSIPFSVWMYTSINCYLLAFSTLVRIESTTRASPAEGAARFVGEGHGLTTVVGKEGARGRRGLLLRLRRDLRLRLRCGWWADLDGRCGSPRGLLLPLQRRPRNLEAHRWRELEGWPLEESQGTDGASWRAARGGRRAAQGARCRATEGDRRRGVRRAAQGPRC